MTVKHTTQPDSRINSGTNSNYIIVNAMLCYAMVRFIVFFDNRKIKTLVMHRFYYNTSICSLLNKQKKFFFHRINKANT